MCIYIQIYHRNRRYLKRPFNKPQPTQLLINCSPKSENTVGMKLSLKKKIFKQNILISTYSIV